MIDLIMPLFCSLYANYDLLGFPASPTTGEASLQRPPSARTLTPMTMTT